MIAARHEGRWPLLLGLTLLSSCGARTALDDLLSAAGGGPAERGGSGGSGGSGARPPPAVSGAAGTPVVGGAPGCVGAAEQAASSLEVVKLVDGEGNFRLYDLAVGPDGNIAAVGDFDGSALLDPGWALTAGPAGKAAWAAVLDPSGNAQHVLTIGQPGRDNELRGVAYNVHGVTATGAPTHLLRIGDADWPVKVFEGDSVGLDVGLGPGGEIVMAGQLRGETDFGGGTVSALATNAFVAAFDTFGNWRWNHVFPGQESSELRELVVDAAGNTLAAGLFIGDIQLGEVTARSRGRADVFIVEFDPNGALIGAQTLPSDTPVVPLGLAPTDDGGFVFVAGFSGTIDIGNGSVSGSDATLVARFDARRQPLWARAIESTGVIVPSGGVVAFAGDFLIAGFFSGSLETPCASFADPDGGGDAFVLGLRGSDGEILWERTLGGRGQQKIEAIAVDTSAGAVYVGGLFYAGIEQGGSEYVPLSAEPNVFLARLSLH